MSPRAGAAVTELDTASGSKTHTADVCSACSLDGHEQGGVAVETHGVAGKSRGCRTKPERQHRTGAKHGREPGRQGLRCADDHPRPREAGGCNLFGVVGSRVSNNGDAGGHDLAHGDRELAVARDHDDAAHAVRRENAEQQAGIIGLHEAPLLSQPGEATDMSVPAGGLIDHRGVGTGAGGRERGHGHTATICHRRGHPTDRQDGSGRGRLSAVCRPQTPGSRPLRRAGSH